MQRVEGQRHAHALSSVTRKQPLRLREMRFGAFSATKLRPRSDMEVRPLKLSSVKLA